MDGKVEPQARRGAGFLGATRFDWSLVLGAVAIGIIGYLIGDRTDWSGGFGYDGRFYGELAKNFPSAVFGHGAVIPPGLGHYEGPQLTGVDSYYAFRILPSGIVWLGLQVLSLSPTDGHVVGLFAGLDAAMFGTAVFFWCLSANLLDLGDRAKVLGAIALIVNFAVLKTGSYYPVLTDHVAFGLGSATLYFWLRGATPWLALCTLVACFAWPPFLVVGPLLLLFPAPTDARERLAAEAAQPGPASWRPAPFGLAIGAVVGLAAVTTLTVIQLQGYRSVEGTEQLPLFPLSAFATGLYVAAVVAFLLPHGGVGKLVRIVRSISLWHIATAATLVVAVLVAGSLLARRPGFAASDLFKDALWSTTLDPGLFLVVLVGYYGPILLLIGADFPRVAASAWRLGPGMAGVLGIGLLSALLSQPREVIEVFPFLVLAGVLATRRIYPTSRLAIAGFLVLSLALSRVWLHIGSIGFDTSRLQEFPAQRYFMATGTWTPPSMYAVQLGAVIVVGALLWLIARAARRPGPPVEESAGTDFGYRSSSA